MYLPGIVNPPANNYVSRESVYKVIDGEREYQDKKWGADIHSVGDWIVFMRTHLAQAEVRFSKEVGTEGTLHELRKVVALGVACMEQNGAYERIEITPELCNKLRDQTGAGLLDCKKALTKAEGNIFRAAEYLKGKL
jgi:hypothetical protein